MSFIPHTAEDISLMLAAIGVRSIDDLFEEIPQGLRAKSLDGVPPALCEMEVGRLLTERAACDGRLLNFLGAGAYEHHIPAPVWPSRHAVNSTRRTRPTRRRQARERCS
jgi:glycine dehydrogenase subunit 1